MKTVFELAYRYIIPYIFRRLVENLHEEGYNVVEIASLLKITPSAVSRYLSRERGSLIDLSTYSDAEEKISDMAREVMESNPSIYDIYKNVSEITIYILSRKYVCNTHVKLDPRIDPVECDVCPQIFRINYRLFPEE